MATNTTSSSANHNDVLDALPEEVQMVVIAMSVLRKDYTPGAGKETGETPSRWLAASRDAAAIDALVAAGWQVMTPDDRPFTDDYADLLRYIQLGG